MPLRPSPVPTGAVLCAAGYVLVRFVPAPLTLARELSQPHTWVARYGLDTAVASIAGALLWLCALWVALGLTAVYLSTLPGLAGRAGRAIASRVLPAAVRHLLLASAGASLLLSPLPAAAAVNSPTAPNNHVLPSGTAPGWPLDEAPATPAPSWPLDPAPAESTPKPATPAGTVTVAAGDSLWRIAATNLGPAATDHQIAVAWPYWYRANRSVIGRDPGLLLPGTELSVPTGPAAHPGA